MKSLNCSSEGSEVLGWTAGVCRKEENRGTIAGCLQEDALVRNESTI